MKAVLFDLDGVLYQEDRAIPGAVETIAWFRRHAIAHLFLTNTTSRPRSALVEKLDSMGIPVAPETLLTPPVAAARWLAANVDGPVALFVTEQTRAEFAGLPQLPADAEAGAAAVVVGDLGEEWSYPRLNRAFRLLMAEPPPRLIALGMTRYWQATDGLRLDAGPFVAALAMASGLQPRVFGKPASPFFQVALDLLGVEADKCLMVGDDIRGDIEGAQAAGLRTLLVRTGKFRPVDLEGDVRPTAVLASIAELPAWWRNSGF